MIIDLHTYRCHPGNHRDVLAIYTSIGAPVQWPPDEPFSVFTTGIGTLHEVIFWWCSDDRNDRDRRRADFAATPGRQSYLNVTPPYLRMQSIRKVASTVQLLDVFRHGYGTLGHADENRSSA